MPGTRHHNFKNHLPLMGRRQLVRAAQVAELVISLPAHIYQMINTIKRFSFSAKCSVPNRPATCCATDVTPFHYTRNLTDGFILLMHFQRICVFCGSSLGNRDGYRAAAERMGWLLAERGIELVYGGGNIGLMGVLADSVLERGGRVIGVIPDSLMAREVGHTGLTELRVVSSMHERKALMSDLSDGFIALPGGFGTLEEFCEVVTWSQLGLQSKPCGLLNVERYYNPLLALFDHGVHEGFVNLPNRGLVLDDEDPERLMEKMAAFRPNLAAKWIGREEG
jgi:uncharacterized protein (TIGR00730 family)